MTKILLVDSDKGCLEELTKFFRNEKFEVLGAINGTQAISKAKSWKPDLIILEIALDEIDGIETCIELRKQEELKKTLIIFYTDRDEEYSQIAAFNAGADDYILKSTRPKLFISRVMSVLNRFNVTYSRTETEVSESEKELQIDRERYLIIRQGEEIVLPRKEFELLALLFSSPRKVFSRKEIADKIWGYEVSNKNRTIDVHIGRIREKIGEKYINTVKGVGYSLRLS